MPRYLQYLLFNWDHRVVSAFTTDDLLGPPLVCSNNYKPGC